MSAGKTKPFIIGIGGTATAGSSTEKALQLALASAERAGAEVRLFDGPYIASLPHYLTGGAAENRQGRELVESVRRADGVILASPGYHGSVSGLVKTATIDALRTA